MNILDPINLFNSMKSSANQSPGSLNYTGVYKEEPLEIDYISYNNDFYQRKALNKSFNIEKNENINWINLTGLHDIEEIKRIGNKFDIHKMDLEDIVHVSNRSKIEERDNYLFSIFKMVYLRENKIVHEHVSIIISNNYIITFQETSGDVFNQLRDRIKDSAGQIRLKDIDYLYYSIIDCLADQYFDILNYISEKFSDIEFKVIDEMKGNIDDIYYLRKELLHLKNAVVPIKDALNGFMRIESKYFNQEVKPYYEDVMDHLNQTYDNITIYREMVNSLYEMQMSNVTNDMNKTMMTLTIFSAIFIPISFLAGVFGMNFTHMPGLNFKYAFYFFMISCIIISLSIVYYFKNRR